MGACCTGPAPRRTPKSGIQTIDVQHPGATPHETPSHVHLHLPDESLAHVRHLVGRLDHSAQARSTGDRRLTVTHMNEGVQEAQFAVRGSVIAKAAEMEAQLADPAQAARLPFHKLLYCNLGNPHAVHQPPLTFFRQVASAVQYPALLDLDPPLLPADVRRRAAEYIRAMPGGSAGAYTAGEGLLLVRQQIAAFLERRDGFPADPQNVHLTTGATEAIMRCIQTTFAGPCDGVLVPCPQYPVYSFVITLFGGNVVYYPLDERQRWSVDIAELRRSFREATARGVTVRSLVAINPGNPCGSVLSLDTIKELLMFASAEGLVVLADEVYQDNVYAGGEFHSFKKALRLLQRQHEGQPAHPIHAAQLVSFHSTSKGLLGECGQRGGYMELVGFSSRVLAHFSKMAASGGCANTLGQVLCGLMVCPPAEGDESYATYRAETLAVFDGMRRRAQFLSKALNDIPGISCQPIAGAMYAFPRVALSERARAAAQREGVQADEFYCMELLQATGIVCVPGSGFGQQPGTWHFRMTLLPPDDVMEAVVAGLRSFHRHFTQTYA